MLIEYLDGAEQAANRRVQELPRDELVQLVFIDGDQCGNLDVNIPDAGLDDRLLHARKVRLVATQARVPVGTLLHGRDTEPELDVHTVHVELVPQRVVALVGQRLQHGGLAQAVQLPHR